MTIMRSSLLLFICLSAQVLARDDAAIKEVGEGKRTEARADWWGFDEKDATSALQAAIRSKARRVIIPNTGKPWIVRPLKLRSELELVLEKGVEIQALRGDFQQANSTLIAGANVRNVTITGNGATLRMWKMDYQKPPYAKSEWRHALSFHGADNVTISDLVVRDSGGDGVYLGTGASGGCKKVTIRNVQCIGHHRQGISVINAEDLLIERCSFNDTSGTAPMAGIDFEPNEPNEKLVRCVLRGCTFDRNAAYGVLFALGRMDVTSEPISITLEDCQVRSNHMAMMFAMRNPAGVRGRVDFKKCVFADSTHEPVVLRTKTLPGPLVTFSQCQFIHLATTPAANGPITLLARGEQGDPVGGVKFEDCTVEDKVSRRPIWYDDAGGLRLKEITGRITVKGESESQVHELNDALITSWFPWKTDLKMYERLPLRMESLVPAFPQARRAYLPIDAWFRGESHFAIRAAKGDTMRFSVLSKIVSKKAPPAPIAVSMKSPAGKVTKLADARVGEPADYQVRATEPGVYELSCVAGPQAASLNCPSLPASAVSANGSMHSIGVTGRLFFVVPAGVKEFALRVAGDGALEQARAVISNAQGQVVADEDKIARSQQIEIKRANAEAAEVWCMQLQQPSKAVIEDVHVMFDGIPAVVASMPEALLVTRGTREPAYRAFPRIALIGDSTVASCYAPPPDRPTLTGWGQVLEQFMVPGVRVNNEALSGRSSKSFLLEGHWQRVIQGPWNYVLIQFGHNDGKSDEARHTDPGSTYDAMLRGYIHQARGLGIKPVLITSVARMLFDEQGKVHTKLDEFAEAMKRVAESEKVPLVDLHAKSKAMLEKIGPKEAARLQANASDHTHFSREGGLAMAKLVAEGLKESVPELAEFVNAAKLSPQK